MSFEALLILVDGSKPVELLEGHNGEHSSVFQRACSHLCMPMISVRIQCPLLG